VTVRHACFSAKLSNSDHATRWGPATNLRTLEDCAVFVGQMQPYGRGGLTAPRASRFD
jgi:hypothetical protein